MDEVEKIIESENIQSETDSNQSLNLNNKTDQDFSSNHRKKAFWITLFSLLILIFAIGFAYYQSIKLSTSLKLRGASKIQNLIPTPTINSTISPVTNGIGTNWKTYTNEKYGYSVKHPVNWKEVLHCEGGDANSDYICFLSPDFAESQVGAIAGSLNGGLVWIDAQNLVMLDSPDKFCTSDNPQLKLSECQKITIDGKEAWERKYNGYNYKDIGILKDGKFVLAIRIVYSPTSEKQITETADQILSTFKFIDQNSTISPTPKNCPKTCPLYSPPSEDWCKNGTIISQENDECGCQLPPKCLDTSNWKTYKSRFGVQIQYPASWEATKIMGECGQEYNFFAPTGIVLFNICSGGGSSLEELVNIYNPLSTKYLVLDGHKSVILEETETINNKYTMEVFIADLNGVPIISINYIAIGKDDYDKYKQDFNQILSTFRFD